MADWFNELETLLQVIAILGVFAGIYQVFLLVALALQGGRVSLWPGIISFLCVVALLVAG